VFAAPTSSCAAVAGDEFRSVATTFACFQTAERALSAAFTGSYALGEWGPEGPAPGASPPSCPSPQYTCNCLAVRASCMCCHCSLC
jgi:hypothetical protein